VGPNGSWIILFQDDLTVNQEIEISGEVYEEEGADAPRRKLALYTQDADRNVTDRYTLTVPRLLVRHVNTRIQSGRVSGNVYVDAEGFELTRGAIVNGNLYFASQSIRESATIDDSSMVVGSIEVRESADAVSHPTEATVTSESNLREAAGPNGPWILIFEGDLSADEEIAVAGAVWEDSEAEEPRRKLALYTQDEDRNVTERYTLTLPQLTIYHMNTRIQSGTIQGDVYVRAEGFEMRNGATIEGNLYFETEEYQETANIDDSSSATGETAVGAP
jgi:cytoskeletal protein CcmA (bactofilin family)